MNPSLMLISAALGAGMLAGCDRMQEPANKPKVEIPLSQRAELPPSPSGAPAPSNMSPAPPQSPPTTAERKDGAPIQGQVDTREPAQRKDFEDKKR